MDKVDGCLLYDFMRLDLETLFCFVVRREWVIIEIIIRLACLLVRVGKFVYLIAFIGFLTHCYETQHTSNIKCSCSRSQSAEEMRSLLDRDMLCAIVPFSQFRLMFFVCNKQGSRNCYLSAVHPGRFVQRLLLPCAVKSNQLFVGFKLVL